MKKRRFNRIIYFIIILSILLIAFICICLFTNFSYSDFTSYQLLHLFIYTLNVIVLSLTLLRITETNTINDKRILRLEKQEINLEISELRIFLCNEKTNSGIPFKDLIIDEANFNETTAFYINWLDKLNTLVDTIDNSEIKNEIKITNDVKILFDFFKEKFYDKIPANLLTNNQDCPIKIMKNEVQNKIKKLNENA